MSFLYPLFLAGVAAVVLPIVLHMIRRHTRKRISFSSLMFLRTTMPRFRSRSSLEHIFLLVLRCLVLCLLALAFARPFLRRAITINEDRPGRRLVLLVDTSASMRRTGMWARALDEARAVMDDTGPSDRVCVMSFDQDVRTLMGFERWATADPDRRAAMAMQDLSQLSPGWASTDLGRALVAAAEAIEDDEVNDEQETPGRRQVVLVGDLQQGSNVEALLAYEWPERTELAIRSIPCAGATNASLQWVTTRDHLGPARRDDAPTIRVSNAPDAARDRFQLRWDHGASADTPGEPVEVYVPAGHSVVLHPPAPPEQPAAARWVLTGDDHDFDNTLYVAPRLEQQVNILYVGTDDPNNTAEMLYYVRRAFAADDALTPRVLYRPGNEPLDADEVATAHMVILADTLSPQNLTALRRYAEAGGVILLVMKSAAAAAAISGLTGLDGFDSEEAGASQYAMLDRIEFTHPLLKPFSDPRFGDFTRIHFWKYRRLDIADHPEARVLAWFDSDDPAWLEIPAGRGALLVWTSGWHPSDSDLALSSKFVPLLYGILEYGGAFAQRQSQYFVGDPVPVPSGSSAPQIRRPDDSMMQPDADRQAFARMDIPGIYTIVSSSGERPFAVNLSAAESRTDPMPVEDIERLGVSLSPASDAHAALSPEDRRAMSRAARDAGFAEMESRQKLWRWVLLATFIILLIEIWLGGWLASPNARYGVAGVSPARPGPASEGEQT